MAFALVTPQISEFKNDKPYDISTIFPLNAQGTCVLIRKHKRSGEGINLEVQTHGDQGYDESFSGVSTQVETPLASGVRWIKRWSK